jgi:hypothetical protein
LSALSLVARFRDSKAWCSRAAESAGRERPIAP